jgi:hypothetical protein
MPDIIDLLHDEMDDPDITYLLLSAIDEQFRLRYPTSTFTVLPADDAVAVTVRSPNPRHPILVYSMLMTDEWEDLPHFRFDFTRTTPPHDTITVSLDA